MLGETPREQAARLKGERADARVGNIRERIKQQLAREEEVLKGQEYVLGHCQQAEHSIAHIETHGGDPLIIADASNALLYVRAIVQRITHGPQEQRHGSIERRRGLVEGLETALVALEESE